MVQLCIKPADEFPRYSSSLNIWLQAASSATLQPAVELDDDHEPALSLLWSRCTHDGLPSSMLHWRAALGIGRHTNLSSNRLLRSSWSCCLCRLHDCLSRCVLSCRRQLRIIGGTWFGEYEKSNYLCLSTFIRLPVWPRWPATCCLICNNVCRFEWWDDKCSDMIYCKWIFN
jgi:hypothetical protein